MSLIEKVQEIKVIDTYLRVEKAVDEVNKLLKEGWKLLAVTQDGNVEEVISTLYTLGR